MDNKERMPLGLGFSLAMDEKAMERFAGMSEAKKETVINRASRAASRAEMEMLVHEISEGKI